MAGGMRTGRGIPMSQRVGLNAEVDECPARHCWVSGSVDGFGVTRPGLLVEWRHTHADTTAPAVNKPSAANIDHTYASRPYPSGWVTSRLGAHILHRRPGCSR